MNNTRSEIFATPEALTRAFSYLSPEGKTHQPDHTAEEQHAKPLDDGEQHDANLDVTVGESDLFLLHKAAALAPPPPESPYNNDRDVEPPPAPRTNETEDWLALKDDIGALSLRLSHFQDGMEHERRVDATCKWHDARAAATAELQEKQRARAEIIHQERLQKEDERLREERGEFLPKSTTGTAFCPSVAR